RRHYYHYIFDIEVSGNGTFFAGTHNPASTIDDSLYTSTDGINFTAAADANFFDNGKFSFNGMRIAVSPSDPNIVYVGTTSASQGLNGVYRSNDNGGDWFRYGPQGGPGFRPLNRTGRDAFIFEVFPDNPNELVVAGNSWYTFIEGDGWTQTAQHFVPFLTNYITSNMYSLVFKDSETMFIGTDQQIIRSNDRGITFSQQSKGYEATVIYSVASIGQAEQSAVIAGTQNVGVVYNGLYDTSLPSAQGYGQISSSNFGEVAASYLHPGSIITQGTDDGIVRSLNAGGAFERFYGVPISPQVSGLIPAGSDTIIDRPNASSGGGQLFNSGGPAQTPFVLDEVIPESVLGENLTKESLREQSEEYLFFASRQYVWVVNGALGDGLQVKWNRVSNELVNGVTEYLSAMTTSGDEDHTVWVSSTRGGLWRLDKPHELGSFDATNDVTQVNTQPSAGLSAMNGRWLSTIAVDPLDPNRVAVAYAGYGGDNSAVQSFIFLTETGNTTPTFAPITGAPANEPIYTVKFVVDPSSGESVLLAGTESGLYTITDLNSLGPIYTSTWTNEFGADFGKVPVYDIDVRLYKSSIFDEDTQDFTLVRDNTVFVATHGRGIWSTSNLVYPRKSNPETPELIEQLAVNLYPNPNQGEASLQLELPENGVLYYSITDINGRQLSAEQRVDLTEGKQEVELDLRRLSPGLYFVQVRLEGKTEVLERTLKAVVNQ
ncbi:MAG: T9SS type A sorting domain-containing protein, partial [Bacteroidota bacterium]